MRRIVFLLVIGASACGKSSPTEPSTPPVSATKIVALSGNLAFDPIVAGQQAGRALTISNSGNATLTITGLTGPSGFSTSWTAGTIAAGGNQAVTIGFAPTTNGAYAGTITVNGDQTSGANTIAVSGGAFPNLIGAWNGTEVASGAGISTTCTMAWIVSTQPGAAFSGSWQTSGNNCGQAGLLSGTVSTGGAVSGLSFNAVVGAVNGCTRTSGDGLFNGGLTGARMDTQEIDTVSCPGVSALTRSITVDITKQ